MSLHISLSIAKYSHTIGERSNDAAWNHMDGSDLSVVLKGDNGGSLWLLVINATTTLVSNTPCLHVVDFTEISCKESIDVAFHVDEALHMVRRGRVVRLQQLPIFAITKEVVLALVYPLSDGQTRRLQFKFHNEGDCRQVAQTLDRRGMTIQNRGEQRPGTACPSTATDRLHTAQPDARPLTAQTTSSYFPQASQQPRSIGVRVPDLDVGSLSKSLASRTHDGRAASDNMQASQTPGHDEIRATREAATSRPSTSQLWRSQTQPHQPLFQESYYGENVPERPSSTSHMATLEAIRQAVAEHEIPSAKAHDDLLSSATGLQTRQWPSGEYASQTLPLSHTEPVERPFTAASRTSVTSALDLPPLQRPKFVTSEPATSATKSSASIPTGGLLNRPSSAVAAVNRTGAIYDTQGSRANGNGSLQSGRLNADATRPLTSTTPVHAAKLVPSRSMLTDGSTNSRMSHLGSTQDGSHDMVSSPGVAKAGSRLGQSATLMSSTSTQPQHDAVARAYSAIRSSSYNAEAEILDQYAMQSQEDRQALLEHFMLENLENPTFVTLCEDVENCWQRISLGL